MQIQYAVWRSAKKVQILLLLVLVPLSFLFFTGFPSHPTRSLKEGWNLGHILYFALLPVLMISSSRAKNLGDGFQALLVVAVTVTLGLLVELLQNGIGRSPDIGDLYRDVIGACVALFLILPLRKSIPVRILRAFQAITVLCIAVQLIPTGGALWDEYQARAHFPILADFETPLQAKRWAKKAVFTIEKDPGHPDNNLMKVHLTTERYSGVALDYFQGDWRQYEYFQFRIFNTREDLLSVSCRIHDREHTKGTERQQYSDRFNQTFKLESGWNTITISLEDVRKAPDKRDMDLSLIQGVGIFVISQPEDRIIYLDDLRLL
jgi:VanZ family protein